MSSEGCRGKMLFVVSLLLMGAAVKSDNAMFNLVTRFNDKDLFKDLALGSPFTCSQHQVCALCCVGNPRCSMFSFNPGTETCQLFGDVHYPDVDSASPNPGARYFAYKTGWCPLTKHFLMLRAVNMCIKLSLVMKPYQESRQNCEDVGARLVVLEDEDKATAVIKLLDNLGLTNHYVTVGLTDIDEEGKYVWADGRQFSRDWWIGREPDNKKGDEDCVFVNEGGLRDYPCDWVELFICEIAN